MKRVSTLFFAIITTMSVFCQTYIEDGDRCFYSGDYVCAISKYNDAFVIATGKEKQIAEIKLTRAKWCAEHIKIADQAFNKNDLQTAKSEYQNVLESNPKDEYVKTQIEKCNTAINKLSNLRKATTDDLNDIWNNKYGEMPQRRQNLIDAGIDPVDAQARINKGEGKPSPEIFSISNENVNFSAIGGKTTIDVKTFNKDYQVVLLPLWCNLGNKYPSFFILECETNNGEQRKDWLIVRSGTKEIKVYISQEGKQFATPQVSKNQPTNNTAKYQTKVKKCFNCPKTNDTWGFTFGYIKNSSDFNSLEGMRLGLKAEPLFKYGFGLNTGINLDAYLKRNISTHLYDNEFDIFSFNIPLHFEYRLNFSKWFNIFAYGGIGINILTNSSFEEFDYPTCFEYGTGLRINQLQFNLGSSEYMGDLKFFQDIGSIAIPYQNIVGSVSIMF